MTKKKKITIFIMPALSHFRGSGKLCAKFIFKKWPFLKICGNLIPQFFNFHGQKRLYNEIFVLFHIYWNSNEIIAILGNFLKYKMRHILLEYFNSASANYKPFIPEECKIAKYIPTYLVDCQIHRITHHWHQLKFCWETCFLLLFIFGTPK